MDKEQIQTNGTDNVDSLINNPFVVFLGKLALAILVVGLLLIISKIIASSVKKKIIRNSVIDDEDYVVKIGGLVGDIVFYTLLIFDIFIGFEILGFDLGILLGGLSFGLGFAFKEILGNMLAGILILTTKDYTLGDVIKVDGNIKYFGTIEEITIRYTVIREFNNQKVIIPNLSLITSPVKTFSTEEFIRLETIVSVHYDTDIDKAKKIILDSVNSLSFIVNKEYTNAITTEFADSGINIKVLFYVDPNGDVSGPVATSIVNEQIKKNFEENNIVIPYPHTVITVDKNDQNLLKTLLFTKK